MQELHHRSFCTEKTCHPLGKSIHPAVFLYLNKPSRFVFISPQLWPHNSITPATRLSLNSTVYIIAATKRVGSVDAWTLSSCAVKNYSKEIEKLNVNVFNSLLQLGQTLQLGLLHEILSTSPMVSMINMHVYFSIHYWMAVFKKVKYISRFKRQKAFTIH